MEKAKTVFKGIGYPFTGSHWYFTASCGLPYR